MRKKILITVLLVTCVCQVACSKEESHSQEENQVMTESKVDEAIAEKEEVEEKDYGAMKPHIMVDGRLYTDTGYVSSVGRCGVMDGKIDSMTEVSKIPEKDNQSNFGTGYEYIKMGEGIVLVNIDGQDEIFIDLAISNNKIPKEVANFNAKIVKMEECSMLVSYLSQPNYFNISEGNYYVSTNNLCSDVEVGDIVRIWFSGAVMETDPAQIGAAYRIEKVDNYLSNEDIEAAKQIALDYYKNTVFEVLEMTLIPQDMTTEGLVQFEVECSKSGKKQDPNRTIFLDREGSDWVVINEGY